MKLHYNITSKRRGHLNEGLLLKHYFTALFGSAVFIVLWFKGVATSVYIRWQVFKFIAPNPKLGYTYFFPTYQNYRSDFLTEERLKVVRRT